MSKNKGVDQTARMRRLDPGCVCVCVGGGGGGGTLIFSYIRRLGSFFLGSKF